MTGGLIRILVCTWLVFTASQASAQNEFFASNYRWINLFGDTGDYIVPHAYDSSIRRTAYVKVIGPTFVELNTHRATSYDSAGVGYYRFPNPEFGLPEAFRRPRQARLDFRIAF